MTSNARAASAAGLIAARIREGEIRTTDVIAEHLDVIDAQNPDLNALAEVFADEAMAAADQIDKRRAAGASLGPLAGVPLSVKMNIDIAGHATTHGIPAFRNSVPPADAPVVARLRAADAVIIGHANMPDMSLRLHTSSQLFGATKNLFDPRLTPGGSSGGDAVAVASGMACLGLGNDAGGSVRVPASFAGICALKPTPGRFPSDRVIGRDLTFASQVIPVDGFLARTVEDLDLAMRVAAGPDSRDPRSVPAPISYARERRGRIGLIASSEDTEIDDQTGAALELAADTLQAAGFGIERVEAPELDATLAAYSGLIMTEFSQAWTTLQRLLGPDVRRYLEHAMALSAPLPLAGYLAATAERMRLQRLWLQRMEPFDALMSPVYCGPIPDVDADIRSLESHAACARALRFCSASSLVGLPAVSISVPSSTGLPVGVQFIAAPFEEAKALSVAQEVERKTAFGRDRN